MKITLEINTNAIKQALKQIKGAVTINKEKPCDREIKANKDNTKKTKHK